jgi:hypothetical protein
MRYSAVCLGIMTGFVMALPGGLLHLQAAESAELNSNYFSSLESIESVVAVYELTHVINVDNELKEVVSVVNFQWSSEGFLYYAVSNANDATKDLSPYNQFVCFHGGKQLVSITSDALGIRQWDREKEQKFTELFFKDNSKKTLSLNSEFVSLTDVYNAGVYNGFFTRDKAICPPPFMIAATTFLFSDGITPIREFKPGLIGKSSLLSLAAPLIVQRSMPNSVEYSIVPLKTSRNANFWSEKLLFKCSNEGIPESINVYLSARKGISTDKEIPICGFSKSNQDSKGGRHALDVCRPAYNGDSRMKWAIKIKELSINKRKPDFQSEGGDLSRYRKIIDLDTGINIEQ